MKDNKEKHQNTQTNIQNESVHEINNIDYGLESVAKGNDFAEGDKDNPPNCGGL
ncbi:hypothetical protein [Bacillus sp. FJAT-18017]|uniref:hypothetical protein n=1 Tax=Bacillus sp. FJAT-18017 TaxID=1705566 RepID=UPI000AE6FCE9|nr:hypothetical protein [Bacillus sp. FJAT-18017]